MHLIYTAGASQRPPTREAKNAKPAAVEKPVEKIEGPKNGLEQVIVQKINTYFTKLEALCIRHYLFNVHNLQVNLSLNSLSMAAVAALPASVKPGPRLKTDG